MSDRSDSSEDDTNTNLDLPNNDEDYYYYFPKSYRLEFCIVKLKNDLNIIERRQPISTAEDSSLIEDITGAVYFQYDEEILTEYRISKRAECAEEYPETHSRKYFFLPQEYIKEGNEAEVSELYTNFILRMELEKPVTVVQVEPADYKAVFENDPNLVWFANVATIVIDFLTPVICMFSEKDQMEQFYTALAERNRDLFMNDEEDYLSVLVELIGTAVKERAKKDLFHYQHIEALSAAFLHILKTSSYISGKAQETQRNVKGCIEGWIDYKFNDHYNKNHPNRPGVFEELQANMFHLHLTRFVYKNYFANRLLDYPSEGLDLLKPAYWNPSNFGWVICEVIEAKLINDREWWNLEKLFMKEIFQQPCFRRLLKDEQLRKNLGNFILNDYSFIIKDKLKPKFSSDYTINMPKMEMLFRGNYEDLNWETFLDKSTLGFDLKKLFEYRNKGISVMDTINFTTAVLGMYPEEKGERRKETAEYLLKYIDKFFILGKLREKCIISEEKETDHFKEMQKILATCFRLPDKPSDNRTFGLLFQCYHYYGNYDVSDVSSELPLDRIYELYCQSNKQINPSAGLLWLGIAHRQAIGSLGELSEEQQANCLEMLASALDDLPLQTIETFFNSIQGFTTRKTVATDVPEDKTPQDVDNMTAELGKTLELTRAERIEKRITAYIAQRKEEETAVLFLLHSEIGINVVKVNANMARYEKRHTTSAGIFVFMTLFEYADEILECTSRHCKKTCDYYVLTFTKYLINNTKVKDIFNKKKRLRYVVREHIKGCLKHYDTYEQLNDLFRLDWQTYYNKWVTEKPIIGQYSIDTIKELRAVGSGAAGSAYLCIVPNFMNSVVYKEFEDGIDGEVTAELNALMKLQAHAHIVRIFGVVMQSLTPRGLLMEYCKGGSLESVIENKGYMFEERAAFHWMAQAASGLKFLHDNNIIHLDVKPANMLLSKNHRSLKLSDMGLTKIGNKQTNFTVTSEKGTVGYQAWEIVDGKDYSYPADIFSLGRCLWSLFYKEHPFGNTVASSVIAPARSCKIFEGTEQETKYAEDLETAIEKTKDLDECDGTVYVKCPGHISRLIIRMTAVDSTLRPTADQMYEELKEMCNAITEKEKDSILRVTPQNKLCFSAPMKDKQTANVEIDNVSKTDNVQWVATCSNPDLKVNPNEGYLKPQEAVTVDVTCIKLKDTSMDNFTITWHRLPHGISHETDDQQEYIKKLKIEYNL